MAKKRLDVMMLERALAESRQKAQAIIMAGQVFVNGQKVDKAGAPVAEDAQIEVRGKTLAYVSRGGLKLEKAVQRWPIQLKGAVCADIGSSTGGFTDCMLQQGAEKVYAVDSGYNQLDWRLRNDPRVYRLGFFGIHGNAEGLGTKAGDVTDRSASGTVLFGERERQKDLCSLRRYETTGDADPSLFGNTEASSVG